MNTFIEKYIEIGKPFADYANVIFSCKYKRRKDILNKAIKRVCKTNECSELELEFYYITVERDIGYFNRPESESGVFKILLREKTSKADILEIKNN